MFSIIPVTSMPSTRSMSPRTVVVMILAAAVAAGSGRILAQSTPAQPPVQQGRQVGTLNTSPEVAATDRTAVDLTIYNSNLSLIRERRTVTLPDGTGFIVVPDIPSTIDGSSLHFKSLRDPSAVRILEQNYQYDLVNQGKLLEKYIGREIEFVRLNESSKEEYTVRGRLIAAGFGARSGIVAEIGGKIELDPAGRLVLPALPEGLILKPRLRWMYDNSASGDHDVELSYLAGGLSCDSHYVALLSKDDKKLDLTGWVTLTNTSGTTFNNAGLKLVAGDVNVAEEQAVNGRMRSDMVMMQKMSEPQFEQTELFEYKLYTLQRKTNLANNETKQIELVTGKDVGARKMFVYDGLDRQWRYWWNNPSYRNQETFGQSSNTKVGIFVGFRNEKENGLGIPLPKGKVRVYKLDEDGKEQFIGEDRIDHTPKDEELRLYLGNAFDVVGERAQTNFKSFAGGKVVEETIRVKLRNHKEEEIEVQVYEHPWRWSEWEITSQAKWEKVDQTTVRFPVTIPAGGEKEVTYTIRYSW